MVSRLALIIRKSVIVQAVAVLFLAVPSAALASYYTLPITDYEAINSWFDHTTPEYGNDQFPLIMTRYDGAQWTNGEGNIDNCTLGVNCYDGHSGVDYGTFGETGKRIFAAASGIVRRIGWQDDRNHEKGAGYFISIWHPESQHSTLYGHLLPHSQAPGVYEGSWVYRGQLLATSGCSGECRGPHLHFNAYSGDAVNYRKSIDPFGWSGSGSDPWSIDQGYLWTDNPPSMEWPVKTVSGTISADATWLSGNVYRIQSSVTVLAGITLTIEPGVIVKFNSNARLTVNGVLQAKGVSGPGRIYLTSVRDDSVGGDTNGDGNATAPASGDYHGLYFQNGSQATFENAVFRYGGNASCCTYPYGIIKNFGGSVTVAQSQFTDNYVAARMESGTFSVDSSEFVRNGNYALYGLGGSLTVLNNAFSGHTTSDGYFSNLSGFTNGGNSNADGGGQGFFFSGTISANQTWNPGIPFVIRSSTTVAKEAALTLNAGVIVKFNPNSYFYVYGNFLSLGVPQNRIYITSLKDDSTGGDTNGDGNKSSPAAADYHGLYFQSGSGGVIENTVLRYGGNAFCCTYPYGVIKNFGGSVSVADSRITDNYYGIRQENGTTTIASSLINRNTAYGIYAVGGGLTVTDNKFERHTAADAYLSNLAAFEDSGNSTTAGGKQGFMVSGSIKASQSWSPGVPFVSRSITVPVGISLTIEPGVVVKFNPDSYWYTYGSLDARGRPDSKIFFTSLKDDSIGGDTNGDGDATTPAPADYRGLYFQAGSTGILTDTVFRYGGNASCCTYPYGIIKNFGGALSIANAEVTNNYYGIRQESGSLVIDVSEITSNRYYGIYASGGGLTLTNSRFFGQTAADAYLGTLQSFVNFGNSSGSGGKQGFIVAGAISSNQTWNLGVVFVLRGVTISSAAKLTITPAVIVKFDNDARLYVSGSLDVRGTRKGRVFFTSIKDDSVGGDTNNDGNATVPAPLDYYGIYFQSGSLGDVKNAVFRYGGNASCCTYRYGVIKNFSGAMAIAGSRITDNYYGINHDSGTTTVSYSSIQGNRQYGFYNVSSKVVNAVNNWWGSETGPYNPNSNPGGGGDRVSDRVNFIPWLTSDPN